MTLTIAIESNDGIALASDSRATFGKPQELMAANDTVQKVYPLSKYSGLVFFGATEVGATLLDVIRETINVDDPRGVVALTEIVRSTARGKYEEWFSGFPITGLPGLGMIIAGYNVLPEGGPTDVKIYVLSADRAFAPGLSSFGFHLAGVPQYATYLLNRFYSRDMDLDSVMDLAAYCILETATQDGRVGGPLQIATVTKQDGCVLLGGQQIESVTQRTQEKHPRLRGIFTGGR